MDIRERMIKLIEPIKPITNLFYSKQKILGGGGVNDLLWGVNWGVLGGLHAMGVYWGGGDNGGPLKWGVVWEPW